MTQTRQQTALTLVGTLLAIFLAALDQTVVATAGPAIQRALHLEAAWYAWLTTSYLVASTVMVPVYGRLSDVWGRKPIILFGLGVFLAGSLGCGLAQTAWQLIACRGVQGLGAAAVFTTSFTLVSELVRPEERGRYAGLLGGVFAVASLVGPLLGGVLTDSLGWPFVFFFNLPLGALALGFIWLRMPARAPVAQGASVDAPGALLLAAGVVPLLLAASLGRSVLREGDPGYPWLSAPMLGLVAASAVGLAAFAWWERRTTEPLLQLGLFRGRAFAAGNAAACFLGGVFLTPVVFLPLFMVNVVGVTNTASALTITPLILGVVAGNLVSGQLVSKLGRFKPLMLAALALMLGGLLLMALTLSAQASQREVTVKMVLLGLGLGPALPLYTLAVQAAVAPEQLGVATSMTTFSRQLGSTLGVALVGSVFATTLSTQLTQRLAVVAQGLPPQVAQRLTQGRSADENDPAGPVFDAAKLRLKLADQLDGARAVALKALAGDALAAALVEQSPFADQALRAAVAEGGVPARVHAVVEALRGRAGDKALLADPAVPEPVRLRLAGAKGDDALEAAWVAYELEEATARVDRTVAAARSTLSRALEETELAFKQAFAEATRRVFWLALGLALLVLAATLALPEGPRRREE